MIPRFFELLVAMVARHPRRAASAALLFMALCALLGTKVRLAHDTRAMVASASPRVQTQLDALSDFTAVDNLLLMLDGGTHPDELVTAADTLLAVLRNHPESFRSARYEIAPAEQLDFMRDVLEHRFGLDPRDPAELFSPASLSVRLRELKARLLAPQGVVEKRFLLRDPLGSLPAALAGLSSAPGLPKLDTSSGRFASQDGTNLLVIAAPVGNPFDGEDAARTMAVVDKARAAVRLVAPHVTVRPLGAHRFAHDAETTIKHDVHFGVLASLVGVLAIFWLFFRRLHLVLVAVPPLLFGLCVAAAAAGLYGKPVHGIVLAFAASCLGLAIDYTVYFVASAAQVGGDPRVALPVAARQLGRSLHLLVGTTVVGLVTLSFSRVEALQQMGLLAIAAVGGAFVGALVWVPVVLPLVSRGRAVTAPPVALLSSIIRTSQRHPRVVITATLALTAGFAWAALGTQLDGDLTHLDTHTPSGQADEAAFVAAFGDPGTSALALIEAPTLAVGLRTAEQTARALHAAGLRHVLSPTALAPAAQTKASRVARWCSNRVERQRAFTTEAGALGFRTDAFASYFADLDALCRAPVTDTSRDSLALLERLFGRPLVRPVVGGGYRLAVAFDVPAGEIAAVGNLVEAIPHVTFVHRQSLNQALVDVIARDLARLGGWSIALVVLVLIIGTGGITYPLRALAPAAVATLAFFGVMAAFHKPINLMNLCVLPLLNGSGTDYGILMAYVDDDPRTIETRAFGLTVASLTTLAGFGPMAFADYYALATIGQSVLLAIGGAAFFALVLPPALGARRRS